MGKKKKFIDKKNAISFQLVHRSQRDPLYATEERSDYVLKHIPNQRQRSNRSDTSSIRNDFIDEFLGENDEDEDDGDIINRKKDTDSVHSDDDYDYQAHMFPDDGYDYYKHLRPMGGGVFIPATDLPEDVFGLEELEEDKDLFHPQVGGAERFLDPEILDLLDGAVETEDNLQDDFLTIANEPKEDGDEDDDDDLPDLIYDDEDEDESYRERKIYSPREKRTEKTLEELMFDKLVDEEYNDEDIGELEEDDPAVKGGVDVNQYAYLMDKFLEETKEESFSSVQTAADIDEIQEIKAVILESYSNAIEVNDDDDVSDDEWGAPPEKKETFDCESIISTYSNLYNHPVLIDDRKPLGKIELSAKSGLPLGVLPTKQKASKKVDDDEEDDNLSTTSTNFGEKRNRNETPEEKKERKKNAKELKRARKEVKKNVKVQYKKEALKQVQTNFKSSIANPSGFKL